MQRETQITGKVTFITQDKVTIVNKGGYLNSDFLAECHMPKNIASNVRQDVMPGDTITVIGSINHVEANCLHVSANKVYYNSTRKKQHIQQAFDLQKG